MHATKRCIFRGPSARIPGAEPLLGKAVSKRHFADVPADCHHEYMWTRKRIPLRQPMFVSGWLCRNSIWHMLQGSCQRCFYCLDGPATCQAMIKLGWLQASQPNSIFLSCDDAASFSHAGNTAHVGGLAKQFLLYWFVLDNSSQRTLSQTLSLMLLCADSNIERSYCLLIKDCAFHRLPAVVFPLHLIMAT